MNHNFALYLSCDFTCRDYVFIMKYWIVQLFIKVPSGFHGFNWVSRERDWEKLTITRFSVQKTPSMSITLKHSKSHPSPSSLPKSTSVDIFDKVLKRLEMIKCTEIGTRAISYGVIFTGLYHDVRFEFNVYINGQGRLNLKTKQNPVWHKPVAPPDTLRDMIDEVVRWVKSVDGAGNMTALQGRSDRSRQWQSFHWKMAGAYSSGAIYLIYMYIFYYIYNMNSNNMMDFCTRLLSPSRISRSLSIRSSLSLGLPHSLSHSPSVKWPSYLCIHGGRIQWRRGHRLLFMIDCAAGRRITRPHDSIGLGLRGLDGYKAQG